MKSVRLLPFGILLVSTVSLAQAPTTQPNAAERRNPWEWSIDQRLAARFEPTAVRARQAARPASALVRSEESVPVDGAKNPELLLPFELMTHFVTVLKSPAKHRQAQLEFYRRHIESAGWAFDMFWSEVEAASATYFAANDAALALQQNGKPPEADRIRASVAVCAARATAIATLRQKLGAEKFDKFLYTAVAPHIKRVTPLTMTAEKLKNIEGGCR